MAGHGMIRSNVHALSECHRSAPTQGRQFPRPRRNYHILKLFLLKFFGLLRSRVCRGCPRSKLSPHLALKEYTTWTSTPLPQAQGAETQQIRLLACQCSTLPSLTRQCLVNAPIPLRLPMPLPTLGIRMPPFCQSS